MFANIVFIEIDGRGFDGEFAPVRHRVAGIHGKIHDDLLDLPGIGLNQPQARLGSGNQVNVSADQPAEDLARLGNHLT